MRLSLSSTACLEVVGVETHHAHVRTLFQVEAEERRAAIVQEEDAGNEFVERVWIICQVA